jgi:hypothetical protein
LTEIEEEIAWPSGTIPEKCRKERKVNVDVDVDVE